MSFTCLGNLGCAAHPLWLTIAIPSQSRHLWHFKPISSTRNIAKAKAGKARSATGAERNEEKQL